MSGGRREWRLLWVEVAVSGGRREQGLWTRWCKKTRVEWDLWGAGERKLHLSGSRLQDEVHSLPESFVRKRQTLDLYKICLFKNISN